MTTNDYRRPAAGTGVGAFTCWLAALEGAMMKRTTANHRHRKSEQPAAEPGCRPMKLVPPTRESFAQGFRTQAKGIREQLVRLGHSQQHPDLPELYDLYQQSVERWTKSARQDLADCPRLPDLPALPKRANPNPSGEPHVIDWYGALVLLREYCEQAAGRLEQAGKPHGDYGHSTDFHSVRWYGQRHTFTHEQAAVVKLLWKAWRNGTPDLSQEHLLEQSKSEGRRLRDIFKQRDEMHAAWGTMIVESRRGVYRLCESAKKS